MKTGSFCTLSNPYYINTNNLRSASGLKSAYKSPKYPFGPVSDRDSLSGRSKKNRIRKASNGSVKVAKMSKKLDFTNVAYREAVGRLKFLLEESFTPMSKAPSKYNKHYIEDSGEDTDNQSQITDRPALSEISKHLSQNYRTPKNKTTNKSTSPYRSSRIPASADYVAGSSVPGGPSGVTQAPPEIIHFIEKQENYIEQLEKESKFCRNELSNLLDKVRDVISENEVLTEQTRPDLGGHHMKLSGSSESEDNQYSKVVHARNVKHGKPCQVLSGPSIVFESRISELEAELIQASIDLKRLRSENAELKRKFAFSSNDDSVSLEANRKRIEILERDKIGLEEANKRLQHIITELRSEGNHVASKSQRSRDIADVAMFEKSQADMEIRRLKEELDKQQERIRELQHEMARRLAEERSNAERRYNYHVEQLGGDLSCQWEQSSKLHLELERQKRFEADLKRDLTQRDAQIAELKQELKDKKSVYLTDLAHVNAERQSLEQEMSSLRLQLDKSERHAKTEAARLSAEIVSLRQRLDRADIEILQARRENLRLNEDIANLEKDIALGELKGEIRPTTKEINKTIIEMEKKHAETVVELEEMIQSQRQLMDKLTTECKTLTNKLEATTLKHKMEISALQTNVELLTNRIISNDKFNKNDPYSKLTSNAGLLDYDPPIIANQSSNQPTPIDANASYSPIAKPNLHHDYTPTYDSAESRQTPTSTKDHRSIDRYETEENEKNRIGKKYPDALQPDEPETYDTEHYGGVTNNQQPQYSEQSNIDGQYGERQYQQPGYATYDQQQYQEPDYNESYEQPFDASQYQGPQQDYTGYNTPEFNRPQPYESRPLPYTDSSQLSDNYSTLPLQSATTKQLPSSTSIAHDTSLQSYATPSTTAPITPTTSNNPIGANANSNIESSNQSRKGGYSMGSENPRNGDRGSTLLSQQSTEAKKRIPAPSN